MAFSAVTERGSITEKVADSSLAMSPSANLTVGKIAFVYALSDNLATTSGNSTDHTSIADTDTNTWNKLYERTFTAGVAADGVTHSLWWTKVATQIDTTDTITWTLTGNAVAKVMMCFECTVGAGSTIQLANDGVPSAFQEATTQTPSVATSGMTSGEYLHIGAVGIQEEFLTWTADSDYTNVFAAAGISSGPAGAAATNVVGFLGYRIATLTGDTFAPTLAASRAMAAALVAIEEVVPAGGTTWPGYISPYGWH